MGRIDENTFQAGEGARSPVKSTLRKRSAARLPCRSLARRQALGRGFGALRQALSYCHSPIENDEEPKKADKKEEKDETIVLSPFEVLGEKDNTVASIWVTDVTKPIYAPSETNYDAWIGYERKLTNKITWVVQLNVRDLFAKSSLIPIAANPDGTVAQVRIPSETTWQPTNTFKF